MKTVRKLHLTTLVATAALAVAGLSGPAAAAPAMAPAAAPAAPAGKDVTTSYSGPAGSISYQVHVPPQQGAAGPLPVVVAMHGCGMTGYGLNSMKDLTDLNRVADREGFLVVYPTQDLLRGLPLNCWSGLKPEHQKRGTGEPALVAGLTKQVIAHYAADADRVHVLGASSGAGSAVILGVTYPDVYATVFSMAGAEYAVNEADPDDLSAVTPVDTAKRAWAQMGERARPVPVLIAQGDQDTTVPPFLADRLVTHWAAIDDLAMNGRLDGQMDDVADKTVQHPASTAATPGPSARTSRRPAGRR